MDPDTCRPQRAAALPPDERRAAIVASTLPLFMAQGPNVTTRQIAEAAGIAEGTIFRVFPDKDALIDAVVQAALDPAPVEAALAAIDLRGTFEDQLVAAVTIIQRRLVDTWQLLSSVGPQYMARAVKPAHTHLAGLVVIFERNRDVIREDPTTAARVLRGFTLAGSHPLLNPDEPMRPERIVGLLLDGLRAPVTEVAEPC